MKVLTVLFISLWTLTERVHSQFMTANCSLAKAVFGAPDTLSLRNRTGVKSPYCKSLNATCCTENDFLTMYRQWEDPKNKTNLRSTRSNEMRQLVTAVRYLKEAQSAVTSLAALIKQAKFAGDPACVTPAFLQGNVNQLDLVTSSLVLFERTAKRCWEFTKNQMNSMMCAACDPSLYSFYEQSKKVIQITNEECNAFVDACGEHIQAMQSITFYFNVAYRLTFCNEKGGFSEKQMPLSVNLHQKTEKAITGCMNIRNKDDCAQVCRSQYGYTTMINYEYANLKNMQDFAAKIRKMVNDKKNPPTKTAVVQSAKRARRRRLQTVNFGFLNNLTVTVMKQGVEFSKYTFNNSDGYTDIELGPVFAHGKILALGSLLLAGLAILL